MTGHGRFRRHESKRADAPTAADLEDLPSPSAGGTSSARFSPEVLRHPNVIQAVAICLVCCSLLLWPNRIDSAWPQTVTLVTAGTCGALLILGLFSKRRTLTVIGCYGLGASILLGLIGLMSDVRAGQIVSVVTLIIAIRGVAQALNNKSYDTLLLPIATLSVGVVSYFFPQQTLSAAASGIAVVSGILVLIAASVAIHPDRSHSRNIAEQPNFYRAWLHNQKISEEDRDALYSKLRYEGPLGYRRLTQFIVLITLSSVIAALGIVTDSTAIVIGAMLVAPLMAPLMGAALSMTMGWSARFFRSLGVSLLGTLLSVGTGVVIGRLSPLVIDTATNSQITSRSSPTIVDFAVAIAAGAAGAYGLCRTELSDALPGVAISISLVPPLAAVGISYSQGDFDSGNGAALLYLTNMIAILLIGAIVFGVMGVGPIEHLFQNRDRLMSLTAGVFTTAMAVLAGLLLNGAEIGREAYEETLIARIVQEELVDDDTVIVDDIKVTDDTVEIVIIAPNDANPDFRAISDEIRTALDRDMTIDVRHIVENRRSYRP